MNAQPKRKWSPEEEQELNNLVHAAEAKNTKPDWVQLGLKF